MTQSPDTLEHDPKDMTLKDRILSEVKFLAGLFAFITVFFTLVWGHYKIPSESMQPTLEVGDHLYVSKFAYGYSRYSLPFGLDRLPFLGPGKIMSRLPKRGDVVVFKHPISGLVMIKRLVGLPGDTIQTTGGRLYINSQLVERKPIDHYLYREHKGRVVGVDVFSEQWDGEEQPHVIYEQTDQGRLDTAGPFVIPAERVFMMGDNRDNSIDSRASSGPGMVPLDHLIGRADLMMFSFKRCATEEGLYCPPKRFLKPL
ncbi:MAG: signal peptidase I [Maricaulaceae bacterium]